jgi:hypothetical protein
VAVATAAATVAGVGVITSTPANARCVWYGPGSGPMPSCYHPQPSRINNCAQTVGQPSACKGGSSVNPNYSYGGYVTAPGAQKTPFGFVAPGCRKTPWGYNCSDLRLKRDVVRVGEVEQGLGLYRFRYAWSHEYFVGVLAQEALNVRPEAVSMGADGYYRVNYAQIGVPMITWQDWQRHHAPARVVR